MDRSNPSLPFPQLPVPTHLFSPPSLRLHRPVRSYQAVPIIHLSFPPFLLLPSFFRFLWSWFLKKIPDTYALSLGFLFFVLPSRHLPISSASRARGTPLHAVLLLVRGAVFRRLFCRMEQPRARRSIRIWRYLRGRMAGYAPKPKGHLAFL